MNTPSSVQQANYGRLAVEIHPDRVALGRAAANACASYLQTVILARGEARVIFACAPSQDEFLESLVGTGLDWSTVTVFHMDEYVGMPPTAPQSFRRYLREHLLDRVSVGQFWDLKAEANDIAAACSHYATLLGEKPIDLICLGIGENGHLAFNDPPVADFNDPARVKRVEIDEPCRRQQVNDGWYPTIEAVPRHALTLTLPVFRDARRLSVHVPGPRKAAAVRATLHDPVTTACPATMLRLHPNATLYLDPASAALAGNGRVA